VKRPWGLSVITMGKVGGDKRGKDKAWELDAHVKNLSRAPCLFRVPCMVLRAFCCLPVYPPFLRSSKQTQKPLQPNSHGQTDTGSFTRTEAHTQQQQAGREASWLKEVRKVKVRVKGEKWVTRPRGRRSKKNFGEKNFEQTRMKIIGATVD
jgi:hypothetical protein